MALFPATSVEGTLIPGAMMALNLQLLLLLLLPLLTRWSCCVAIGGVLRPLKDMQHNHLHSESFLSRIKERTLLFWL